jgi:hypothetical protein
MPYEIQSRCRACGKGDKFLIGNWPEHLGVYVCASCRALVNVPVGSGHCPGCGHEPTMRDFYDYSLAIPYLGGQMPHEPEPGPLCQRCQRASLSFENNVHLNMGMVVYNVEKARATWGRDFMEKAVFMNSTIPVIKEFQMSPVKVFEYFNLDIPSAPLITQRISFPILLDIRTHLGTAMMLEPERFGGKQSQDEVFARMFGCGAQAPPQKRWWQIWK